MMNSAFNRFAVIGAAVIGTVTMTGCSTINGRTNGMAQQKIADVPQMSQVAVVRDPCNSVGIEAVPATQVTRLELQQNIDAGRKVHRENGYIIFSDESLTTKFAPLAGAVAGGVIGSSIGAGAGRAIMGTVGVIGGALAGDEVKKKSRVEDLTDLAACRAYLRALGSAPIRGVIDMYSDPLPINTTPRGLRGPTFIQ